MYRKPFAGDLATAMIEQMQAARRQPLGSSMVLAFWKWGRRMTHVDPYRPSGGEGRMVRDWALHTYGPRHGSMASTSRAQIESGGASAGL
jgi:hypothetical protein